MMSPTVVLVLVEAAYLSGIEKIEHYYFCMGSAWPHVYIYCVHYYY